MTSYRTVAALGSSFAAGPGIDPVVDVAAMRSGRNYAHLLADRLGADLVDLTVSGATTANIIDTPQDLGGGNVFAPQIDDLPAGADLVTITAGGNDLRFAGSMLSVAWHRVDPTSPLIAVLGGAAPDSIPVPSAADVERATAGLVRVVERTRAKAARSRVVLVDYLTVLDGGSSRATAFSDDEVEQFLVLQSAVTTVFSETASRTGVELVRASELGRGHALGAVEPWVQPFSTGIPQTFGSFHPNGAGMTAIADAVEQLIRR